jgi:hypothetical protein
MKGIFELKDARDLLAKLRRDYKKLTENPIDSDAAFNFFVTAEHMPEWAYPGKKSKHSQLRDTIPLNVCSHIANGAKHFEATATRHKSVADTKREGAWFSSGWGFDKYFGPAWGFQGRLTVHLDGDVQAQLGRSITALELADMVLKFWEKELSRQRAR